MLTSRLAQALIVASFVFTSCATFDDLFGAARVAHQVTNPEAAGAPQQAPAGNAPARCCVNRQFFECSDQSAAVQCIGEPFALQRCMSECPFGDDHCTSGCFSEHGPDPSGCERDSERDAECRG